MPRPRRRSTPPTGRADPETPSRPRSGPRRGRRSLTGGPVDGDRPRIRRHEPVKRPDERRLARAVRAGDDQELAFGGIERVTLATAVTRSPSALPSPSPLFSVPPPYRHVTPSISITASPRIPPQTASRGRDRVGANDADRGGDLQRLRGERTRRRRRSPPRLARARAQRRARPPERVDDDGTEGPSRRQASGARPCRGRGASRRVDDRADRGSSERVRPEVARRLAHELAHTGGAALNTRGAPSAPAAR